MDLVYWGIGVVMWGLYMELFLKLLLIDGMFFFVV